MKIICDDCEKHLSPSYFRATRYGYQKSCNKCVSAKEREVREQKRREKEAGILNLNFALGQCWPVKLPSGTLRKIEGDTRHADAGLTDRQPGRGMSCMHVASHWPASG